MQSMQREKMTLLPDPEYRLDRDPDSSDIQSDGVGETGETVWSAECVENCFSRRS